MAPSGSAGTAPEWGVLLRGCAVAETIVASTSVTYNPITDSHESLTFHLWIGSTRYVLLGARGNCMIRVDAQGIPYLEFEFTGLFSQPSEQSRPTPDTSALVPFAPVWLAAAKDSASDDLILNWIRRDRDPSADSWEFEPPMSETAEAWEVDILDGSTVKRTLSSSTTSVTYSAADQSSDFGAAPLSTVTFQVFQIGALGRGDGRTTTASVT